MALETSYLNPQPNS